MFDSLTLTKAIVGINEVSAESINIYPNPTNGFVQVNIEKKNLKKINIYDIYGRLVKTVTTTKFSMNNHLNGLYLLVIETNNEIIIEKLIKE